MPEPKHRFLLRRRVEFADTDVAGIMHFANFFRFMEVTEHAFFRSLGISVFPAGDDVKNGAANVGWPRIHVSADYKMPLHFEEEVEIELLVKEIGKQKIEYIFRFWKNPDSETDREIAATGRFVVICVKFDTETRAMKAVSIPDDLRGKIQDKAPLMAGFGKLRDLAEENQSVLDSMADEFEEIEAEDI